MRKTCPFCHHMLIHVGDTYRANGFSVGGTQPEYWVCVVCGATLDHKQQNYRLGERTPLNLQAIATLCFVQNQRVVIPYRCKELFAEPYLAGCGDNSTLLMLSNDTSEIVQIEPEKEPKWNTWVVSTHINPLRRAVLELIDNNNLRYYSVAFFMTLVANVPDVRYFAWEALQAGHEWQEFGINEEGRAELADNRLLRLREGDCIRHRRHITPELAEWFFNDEIHPVLPFGE